MQRTIQNILSQDQTELQKALGLDSTSARIEVQCLLQNVLRVNRAYLITHSERILNPEEETKYQALFSRRLNGEPIAYILGNREFYGLYLTVTPATLIPRPETELLVELALERMPSRSADLLPLPMGEGWGGGVFRVLDMGTGSGAIALAIAHQYPQVEVFGCDASETALEVACENAQRLGITNVNFICSNWFSALDKQRFDIIVSNPPYIAAEDPHLLQGDLRFEPKSALASGEDGLDDIRHIIALAGIHLNNNSWLLLEHGYDQAVRIRALLQSSGFMEVFSAKDLSGIERCSGGKFITDLQ